MKWKENSFVYVEREEKVLHLLKTSQELRKAALRVVGCQGVEV